MLNAGTQGFPACVSLFYKFITAAKPSETGPCIGGIDSMNQPGKRVIVASFFLAILLLAMSLSITVARFGNAQIEVTAVATYETGIFDESAAEIVAHDPQSQKLFIVNGDQNQIDVLDISDPYALNELSPFDMSPYGDQINSVDVHNGIVAAAVKADPGTAPGVVVFLDTDGNYIAHVTVGALPDMLTFTPNGKYVLVANEGEPNDDYTIDPEGSVSIINLTRGVYNLNQSRVMTAGFTQFNDQAIDPRIRIFGPGASVAQDLEPEYIAVSGNSRTAWVALQENNALAVIDIRNAVVTDLVALGVKDHSASGNGIDASNRDDVINIANWPVMGMYQPDAITTYKLGRQTYIFSANEGDSREYDGFVGEERIKDLELDPTAFPNAEALQEDEMLGRLKVTITEGDIDNDGDYDALYSYGGRSFSIWSTSGELIYDSGDDFEQILAQEIPDDFNSNNDENDSFDSRSDDKGPEPEAIAIGKIGRHVYAFIGLERVGGIMIYNVTNPYSPVFVDYVNNRDFGGDAESGTAGDLGPEDIKFISAQDSPTGSALLVVANEVSGTTTIYSIE